METNTAVVVAPFESRTEFDNAVTKVAAAAKAYYDTDTVIMVDADYDTLIDRIAKTRETHPEWDDQGVTTGVAAGQSAGGDVTHSSPMLSLDKVTDAHPDTTAISEIADLNRFLDRAERAGYSVTVKIDGNAVSARYANGRLVQAATRGDGRTGEDITPNVLRSPGIHGLPLELNEQWTGEVRGEIFMTDTDFETASNNRVTAGGKPFANPRNATSGSLRALDRTYDAPMSFGAYSLTDDMGVTTHTALMQRAEALGFTTADMLTPGGGRCDSASAAKFKVVEIKAHRNTLGFPTDGAVITYDGFADRAAVGEGNRTPKWGLAVKFPPQEIESRLLGVDVAVGRTGRMSLTAHIEPVQVDGSVVSRASGHNPIWFHATGLGIGHRVMVVKRGDIIPYISLLDGPQDENVTPWVAPETCPQCDEAWDKSSLLWRCHTPSCSLVGRIEWFGERSTLDIEGLSTATAEALVEAGLVNDIADLFDLTVEQVAAVKIGTTPSGADRLIGTTTATRLVNGIEAAKSQPLNRVIASLGLRFTGKTFGRRFADHFKSLEAFRDATLDDLMQVEAVKEGRGTLIYKGLQESRGTIDRLIAAGVTTTVEEAAAPEGKELPFVGMKVVVSGTVPGMGRTEAQEAAIKLGATVSGSVSKNTSLLVAGDGAGSKMTKAESLGVKVMPADEFAALYASIFG